MPGDCGEAVHLQGTTNSQIVFNRVDHNIGGILVTDESGPTTGNLIASNRVVDNMEDCGITMPSHVPGLGVKNNVVKENFVAGNSGAGVLIATPAPGMAVTGNLVTRNVILNNGEGGIQLHTHARVRASMTTRSRTTSSEPTTPRATRTPAICRRPESSCSRRSCPCTVSSSSAT